MSLINCPECGRENVSDSAVACPGCGFGIKQYIDEKKYHEELEKTVYNTIKENRNLDVAVTDIINEFGVPSHIKGYHYLREAIIQSINDKKMLQNVTQKLYPSVAEKFTTTPSRVERGIRHAIEIAWDRGEPHIFNSFFGYNIYTTKYMPTNSDSITVIANKLTMH